MQRFNEKMHGKKTQLSAQRQKFARAVSQGGGGAKGEETASGWVVEKPRPMQFFFSLRFVEDAKDESLFTEEKNAFSLLHSRRNVLNKKLRMADQ